MAKKESSSKSVTFDAIDQQIREKRFAPVYLLHGEEPFFIDRLCKMFEEGILEPEERDFNQVVLYGKDTTADMVLANAKQFPFGSPYRVVILKEAKELKNIELLSTYAENPSPQTIFIVCYKYGKMNAAQVKPYSKHGVVFESEGVKDWKLNEWIQNLAEKTFHFRLNHKPPPCWASISAMTCHASTPNSKNCRSYFLRTAKLPQTLSKSISVSARSTTFSSFKRPLAAGI